MQELQSNEREAITLAFQEFMIARPCKSSLRLRQMIHQTLDYDRRGLLQRFTAMKNEVAPCHASSVKL